MNLSTLIAWEDRLTRLSFALLVLAVAYGVIVGAGISMYYDVIPNMGSLEDRLGSFPALAYLIATIAGVFHAPFLVSDMTQRRWGQATLRATLAASPLIVFLGTEGLISHYLGWAPISETDRFHVLHHSLMAGVPLTVGYGLVLRKWWQPGKLMGQPAPSRRAWLVSWIVVFMFGVIAAVLLVGLSPSSLVAFSLIGLAGTLVLWRALR